MLCCKHAVICGVAENVRGVQQILAQYIVRVELRIA